MAQQARGPVGGWLDGLEEMHEQHERVVELALIAGALLRIRIEIGPKLRRLFSGKLEGNDKSLVPDATVVGRRVSHNTEVMEKGTKNLFVEVVGIGDRLTQGGILELPEQIRDIPEGRHLDNHPRWRPRHLQMVFVVLDELLFAAAHLGIELTDGARMEQRVIEVTVLQISEWPKSMPDLVGPPCANGNFHALARFQKKLAKAAVKVVEIPKLFECGSRLELIWRRRNGERKPVCRKPVVIMVFQGMEGESVVPHGQPARFEAGQLLLVSLSGLAHRLLPSGRVPKLALSVQKRNLPGAHRGEA